MKLHITATHSDMTDAFRVFIERKMGTLSRFLKQFEKEGEVNLFVEIARSTKHHRHGNVFYAEGTLHLPGKTMRAEHYDIDARVAVEVVKDMLKRDIEKHKEKSMRKKRTYYRT